MSGWHRKETVILPEGARKRYTGPVVGFSGALCEKAGVEPGKVYNDPLEAIDDARKLCAAGNPRRRWNIHYLSDGRVWGSVE